MTTLIMDQVLRRWISLTIIRYSKLQWLRSIIRKPDVVGRPSSPFPVRLRQLEARVVVSSFTPPTTTSSSSNNSRIGRDIFFPFSLSWRFARIHSSPTSEGANGRRQKLEGGREKSNEQRRQGEPRWSGIVIASPASCPLCRLSINHRRKHRNNVLWNTKGVCLCTTCTDRYFDFVRRICS